MRQADLGRAVSSAYYALFHVTMTALADVFVGSTHRASPRYTLIYRSVDHKQLRDLCEEVQKPQPRTKYLRYVTAEGFGSEIKFFASSVLNLRYERNAADYDPQARFRSSEAMILIGSARNAVAQFRAASEEHRRIFLTLLLCPPRE